VTPQQTAQVLRQLHAAFGTEVTEDMGRLWAEVFSGDEAELVRDATVFWIRERSKFPTPAELREVMRRMMQQADIVPPLGRASELRVTGKAGGWQIAYDAYCDTVRKAGREPKTFEQFIGQLPIETKR
jgi:hypothetical protein